MRMNPLRTTFLLLVVLLLLASCTKKKSDGSNDEDTDKSAEAAAKVIAVEAEEHDSSGVSGEGRAWTVTFGSQGVERSMEVYAPAGDDGARSLLLIFHGYGDNAASLAEGIDAQNVADTLETVVVLPDGLINTQDERSSWNAGECCAFGDEDRDDVALIEDIPAALQEVLSFDENTLDVAGFSNGGFFVERLLCEKNDRIRGGLNIAGGLGIDPEDCAPEGDIRLVRVHGSADDRVPFAGGQIEGVGGTREIASFNEGFAFWRGKLGCSRVPESVQRGYAACRQQFDCPNGHMEFCEVLEHGHQWPTRRATGLDVFDVAWQVWTRGDDEEK